MLRLPYFAGDPGVFMDFDLEKERSGLTGWCRQFADGERADAEAVLREGMSASLVAVFVVGNGLRVRRFINAPGLDETKDGHVMCPSEIADGVDFMEALKSGRLRAL